MPRAEVHVLARRCRVLQRNRNISLFWGNTEGETTAALLAGVSPPSTRCFSCFAGPSPSSSAFQQQVLLSASLKPSSSSSFVGFGVFFILFDASEATYHPINADSVPSSPAGPGVGFSPPP